MKTKQLIVLLLLSLALASCGGGGGGDGDAETPQPDPGSGDETVTFPKEISLSSFTGSATINEGTLRTTRFSSVNISTKRARSRTTVNVAAGGETISAKSFLRAQFTAKRPTATLHTNMRWKGTLLSSINLSASTEMRVTLRVREVTSTGSLGSEVFSQQLERDGIGSGLKSVEILNVNDNVNRGFQLNLIEGRQYRAEVELECRLKVDGISLALIDCNAESDDRGVYITSMSVEWDIGTCPAGDTRTGCVN